MFNTDMEQYNTRERDIERRIEQRERAARRLEVQRERDALIKQDRLLVPRKVAIAQAESRRLDDLLGRDISVQARLDRRLRKIRDREKEYKKVKHFNCPYRDCNGPNRDCCAGKYAINTDYYVCEKCIDDALKDHPLL